MQYLFSLLGCTLLPCRYWWEKEFSLWCLWWTWRLVYFYVYWQILSRSWYQKSCEDALQKAANFYKAFWEMHYNLTRIKLLNRQIISFSHFYDISLQILKVLSCFFSLSFLFLLWQMLVITMQGLKSDASTRVPLVWNPMRVRECRSCESRKEHLNQSFVRLAYNILNKDLFVN